MKKFISIIFILTFHIIVFSQEDERKHFYESPVKNEIFNNLFYSYDHYTKWELPEEAGPHFFGCGTAAHQFSMEIDEKKRVIFHEKYAFLVEEILEFEKDPNKLKSLEIFWMKFFGQKEEDENEEENEDYIQWKLDNQYKPIIVKILVEELNKKNENLSFQINFQRKNEQFSKKYSFLSKNSNLGFVEVK